MLTKVNWLLLIIGVMLSAGGAILLKVGATNITYSTPVFNIAVQLITNWKLILGVVCYAVPVFIWIYLLKSIDVSHLQPLFASIYVVTPLLAKWFLGEDLNPVRWVGIGIIIMGIIIFARG